MSQYGVFQRRFIHAVLPALALRAIPTSVELRGGVFQDFAPSVFHLQHVIMPLLQRMGLRVDLRMERPGYVPVGGGILRLQVGPIYDGLRSLELEAPGKVDRLWGLALASHLAQRRVGERMAEAATTVLAEAGRRAAIEVVNAGERPGGEQCRSRPSTALNYSPSAVPSE